MSERISSSAGKAYLRITKNNFASVYLKWLEAVKPTIGVNWDAAKKSGIIDADFYLADLLSEHNITLREKLYVLLRDDRYELDRKIDASGLLDSKKAFFNDGQKAHQEFWNRYNRPPKREYWDYIVNRRDLLVPQDITTGLTGMDLLQTAMQYHLGSFGIVFIAVILALFSFSTFLGVLYYARGNVAYLCGDNWWSQTAYKLLALAMLLVGGTQAYTVVWDLGDVGIGLMTIFNMLALVPLSGEALTALNDYEKRKKIK